MKLCWLCSIKRSKKLLDLPEAPVFLCQSCKKAVEYADALIKRLDGEGK